MKKPIQITCEQAKKAIELCFENAKSFLNDADILIKNNVPNHISIPIEFALEEVGKAKIIFDKLDSDNSIIIDDKDGFYDHVTKLKKCTELFELDPSEEMAENLKEIGTMSIAG